VHPHLGKIWNFLERDTSKLELIKQEFGIGDIVARILLNRNLSEPVEVETFLKAKLRNTIPDPHLVLDVDKGVNRLVDAIQAKEKVMVFGDYDIDGITSTYIVVKYLKSVGIEPLYKIPNRFDEGYGLTENVVLQATEQKVGLLIVVDSGICSIDEVEIAKKHGLDIVIIDHHLPRKDRIPDAVAVINPNREDQAEIGNSYIKNFCAVGVVFVFIIALQMQLKKIGFFEGGREVDLYEFIDIVALGTLCDAVKLVGMNRAIVKHCLMVGARSNGILRLMEAFNIPEIKSSNDFAYYIGPAMNAAGRMSDPIVALELFLEKDETKARAIAEELLRLNGERRAVEKQAISEAMAIVAKMQLDSKRGICVFGDCWSKGVIGIVSGRLKDKFSKPSFVISFNEDGIGKGSSRSIEGFHIGDFLTKAREEGIIIDGGGHALAGGFSIHKDKINDFVNFLDLNITHDFVNYLNIDYSLSANSDFDQIYSEISSLAPFGMGFENPIFAVRKIRLKHKKMSKSGEHLMLSFAGEFGDGAVWAIVFGIAGKQKLAELFEEHKDDLMDIAGRLNASHHHRSSFVIEDARLSPA
jgi:single-stranded-DNA-specific exonuclease